jgi:hypothetical protein
LSVKNDWPRLRLFLESWQRIYVMWIKCGWLVVMVFVPDMVWYISTCGRNRLNMLHSGHICFIAAWFYSPIKLEWFGGKWNRTQNSIVLLNIPKPDHHQLLLFAFSYCRECLIGCSVNAVTNAYQTPLKWDYH